MIGPRGWRWGDCDRNLWQGKVGICPSVSVTAGFVTECCHRPCGNTAPVAPRAHAAGMTLDEERALETGPHILVDDDREIRKPVPAPAFRKA